MATRVVTKKFDGNKDGKPWYMLILGATFVNNVLLLEKKVFVGEDIYCLIKEGQSIEVEA